MISVIVYGRNDAHGYNLHRRAALSLNCIAEVLTDPDDEVIFVDYNTPDELPTFIEAISDTLTERCLDRLRVLRVPAAVHDELFAARTHLPAVEPVARNAAVRRANPSNRWVLSTNTDMIFVPLAGHQSMSEICGELEDGFYGLPRFELPEWLWESLPRSDSRCALAEISRLGPGLRLDEPTTGHEWIRFDAPGDFQLILREDFVAIDGCDEEMLQGYHVDSNLSRRLLLHRGSIESLEEQLSGYHCNHNRTRTVYHGAFVTNDLDRFFYSLDEATLPEQRSTWGLPEVTVEEVPIRHGLSKRCASVLTDVVPTGPRVASNSYDAAYSVTYDSGHVVPFITDALVVASLDARIGYVGVNSILERMLRVVVDRLGFEHPMEIARFDDLTALEQIACSADVFIIDLGVDVSQHDVVVGAARQAAADGDAKLPTGLVYALLGLDRLIKLERGRSEEVGHPRLMMLVNSSAVFFDGYVLAQFDCSHTTTHSRVRRATVKRALEVNIDAIELGLARDDRLVRWSTRGDHRAKGVALWRDERVDIVELEDYGGFRTGWAFPDEHGVWTEGPRSELMIRVGETSKGDYVLTLMVEMICVTPGELLRVVLLANGERVATRDFGYDDRGSPWRVDLPPFVWAAGEIELTLAVEDPRSPRALGWSTDERALGIRIRTLTVEQVDRRVALGEEVAFSEGAGGERFLVNGWSMLEATGVWTVAEEARLAFWLTDSVQADVEVVLDAMPFVTPGHPELEVEVWTDGECVTLHTFRYGEGPQPLRVRLSEGTLETQRRVLLDLRLRHPARPVDLGLNTDPRRLGVQLRSLTIRESVTEGIEDVGAQGGRKLRRLLARSRRR